MAKLKAVAYEFCPLYREFFFKVNIPKDFFFQSTKLTKFAAEKLSVMFIIVVLVLFIAAIAAPWVWPNTKVSDHKKDWEV